MPVSRTPVRVPLDGKTFHLIGDVHAGTIAQWRMDKVVDDFRRTPFSPIIAHIQVGDNTENGQAAENTTFESFRNDLSTKSGKSVFLGMGNHDGFELTGAQWATRWGYQSQSYVHDFDNVRLIVLTASKIGAGLWAQNQLSDADLTWLDNQLAGTVNPCICVTHYPCYNTCLGGAVEYQSIDASFYLCGLTTPSSSADVLSVISGRSNFKAWISGHTHSRLTVPGLITTVTTGAVTFASINASSIFYQGSDHPQGIAWDKVPSMFLTWYAATSKFEVRIRDHGAGVWVAPIAGNPVTTVTVSA